MSNIEKLLAEYIWKPIKEAPKEHGVGLLGFDACLKEYVMEYSVMRNGFVFSWEQELCGATHFRALPDDRLAEVCEVLLEGIMKAKEVYTNVECRLLDEALQRANEIAGGE